MRSVSLVRGGLSPDDLAGPRVTYYCCMKQGIRLIDKTRGTNSEMIFGPIYAVSWRLSAIFCRSVRLGNIGSVASGFERKKEGTKNLFSGEYEGNSIQFSRLQQVATSENDEILSVRPRGDGVQDQEFFGVHAGFLCT